MDRTPKSLQQMKVDFSQFLSSASKTSDNKPVFRLDHSILDAQTTQSLSMRSLLEHEKANKQKEADLIAAKAQIAQLETQIGSLKTSFKRARIEFETDVESITHEKEREHEEILNLKSQLSYLAQREHQLHEELADCQKDLVQQKTQYEDKLLAKQKEYLQLENKLHEAQEEAWEQSSALKNELLQTKTEMCKISSELDEAKAQLKLQLGSVDLNSSLKELEDHRHRATVAEQRVRDLESELARNEENITITKSMKSLLDKVPDLEREIRKLREDNKYYKEREKNVMLLEEQVTSLEEKLERANRRMADFTEMQLENEDLKGRLQRWEALDTSGSRRPRSPCELSRLVAEHQRKELLLLEQQGQLQTRLNVAAMEKDTLKKKYEVLSSQHHEQTVQLQQQADLIKRLQRKLLLVTKEREGLKKVLDSYESEVTMNVAQATASRIEHLGELVEGYRKQAGDLEAELSKHSEQMSKTQSQCMQLQSKSLGGEDSQQQIRSQQDKIRELQEKVIILEQALEKKEQEKDILEARIEQRHLQGDYDPTRTKVVHFSMNPAQLAQDQRSLDREKLQEENEKLKQRLKLLEEGGGWVEDLTIRVDEKLQEPDSSKQIEEVRSQLSKEQLKNKRLMEAFKKTSHEFRDVCYQLTGYKIDLPSSNQYRLTSMFAESPKDYLLFQQSPRGEIQMLQTDFSETVKDLIELYLSKQDCIPGFLSSVTLDLFGRQTMNLG
ncbi:mitotic spindle assembly checkpoint protein MAD1-like isoform X2 [Gigantopelta aegis]|uniref:mitotic spindle assembly checkpoint protein MAD1-like isoform X2 n=1 Tax=Gigantopelta aegis TaxID=1735272 RepID=UPI001B88D0D7|nr:mitotic spindle assembly checkpoint protein MAD1-like isoform X2 [Gigantopelta aegis]